MTKMFIIGTCFTKSEPLEWCNYIIFYLGTPPIFESRSDYWLSSILWDTGSQKGSFSIKYEPVEQFLTKSIAFCPWIRLHFKPNSASKLNLILGATEWQKVQKGFFQHIRTSGVIFINGNCGTSGFGTIQLILNEVISCLDDQLKFCNCSSFICQKELNVAWQCLQMLIPLLTPNQTGFTFGLHFHCKHPFPTLNLVYRLQLSSSDKFWQNINSALWLCLCSCFRT